MASQVASTSMQAGSVLQAQSSQERLRGVVLGTSKAVEVIDPSAVSRAGSQCSTAAPPTPDSSSSSTPPLDVRDLATLEEDDDEIMQGMPPVELLRLVVGGGRVSARGQRQRAVTCGWEGHPSFAHERRPGRRWPSRGSAPRDGPMRHRSELTGAGIGAWRHSE
eukprot:CAMPEP_0176230404 /NCGR_PEP_ID=MMETSP0121_2-20121125/24281_1 /TAXON_ID=160619 /ORGANISM="Kryptoperidinium foliaceum, Strain CCMP 1326" /LENGTH=163 /DNA_ID=CAMNT_0017569745 /DNA_START=92 /DNA_END=579 /DNA_ORIENTATION=-